MKRKHDPAGTKGGEQARARYLKILVPINNKTFPQGYALLSPLPSRRRKEKVLWLMELGLRYERFMMSEPAALPRSTTSPQPLGQSAGEADPMDWGKLAEDFGGES